MKISNPWLLNIVFPEFCSLRHTEYQRFPFFISVLFLRSWAFTPPPSLYSYEACSRTDAFTGHRQEPQPLEHLFARARDWPVQPSRGWYGWLCEGR